MIHLMAYHATSCLWPQGQTCIHTDIVDKDNFKKQGVATWFKINLYTHIGTTSLAKAFANF